MAPAKPIMAKHEFDIFVEVIAENPHTAIFLA